MTAPSGEAPRDYSPENQPASEDIASALQILEGLKIRRVPVSNLSRQELDFLAIHSLLTGALRKLRSEQSPPDGPWRVEQVEGPMTIGTSLVTSDTTGPRFLVTRGDHEFCCISKFKERATAVRDALNRVCR